MTAPIAATAIALVALTAAGAASAATGVGLAGERTLVMIDTATAEVTGQFDLPGEGRILGIDWRPADKSLYAVSDAGEILRVDLAAKTATAVATTATMLPLDGPVAMDFNPMADKLRLMSGTTNHRINPDTGETTVDGALHFDAAAEVGEAKPMIVATAYANSFGKPEATAQYNIDAGMGALVRQTAPNDGVLMPIGMLGIDPAETYAFDIATDAAGMNTGWLVADDMLHTVSLEDGSVTASWPLPEAAGGLRDLTILSEM